MQDVIWIRENADWTKGHLSGILFIAGLSYGWGGGDLCLGIAMVLDALDHSLIYVLELIPRYRQDKRGPIHDGTYCYAINFSSIPYAFRSLIALAPLLL